MAALHMAGAADFIARLPEGLATEVGEKGARFSGGQRQRIAIARALVHRPKLLILDEVTSALDAATEQEICENIREISKTVTVLAISHRQAWIDIADHVFVLGARRTWRMSSRRSPCGRNMTAPVPAQAPDRPADLEGT